MLKTPFGWSAADCEQYDAQCELRGVQAAILWWQTRGEEGAWLDPVTASHYLKWGSPTPSQVWAMRRKPHD